MGHYLRGYPFVVVSEIVDVINGAFPLHGTARYGTVHFWGVFHWVLYLVPDTFLVPLRSRFHASRTVTKTWRVNSTDHWLAGENRHYCVTELATRDPPLQPDPLDLNQHSQRRIGRNFCLNKRTFLHQPQNSSVVVCWGRTDVPLVDSRGADPARAWWHDAEGKSLLYNVTFELAIFSEYVFCLYFYLCICVLLQLKTIWSNKCTSSRAGRYGWKLYHDISVSYRSISIIIDIFYDPFKIRTRRKIYYI